jgi:DNA anti-recombination protein RmuC
MAWSDERLDDLARHIDTRFDAVDKRFELVDRRFEQVERRFEQVDRRFDQVDRRFDRVEDALGDLSRLFLRIGGGVIVGLIGVIAAVLSTA